MKLSKLAPLWFVAVVFGASPAVAECLNLCSLRVDMPQIDPPLACVTADASHSSECNCALALKVQNSCDTGVVAKGFTFGCSGEECSTIAPGKTGGVGAPLDDLGSREHRYVVSVGESEHTISVVTHVDSFEDDDGGCALAAVNPTGPGTFGWLGVSAGALLALRRRWHARMLRRKNA